MAHRHRRYRRWRARRRRHRRSRRSSRLLPIIIALLFGVMATIIVVELFSPGTIRQLFSPVVETQASQTAVPAVMLEESVPTPVPGLTASSLPNTVLARSPTSVPTVVVIAMSPRSVPTATHTPVPTPTHTATPAPIAMSVPTATHTPVPTPTHTATPAPTAMSVPTATPLPALRHQDLKKLMRDLVNRERTDEGLRPVALGDNVAAQIHAEGALRGCYASHWDAYGLKPYMRYSLAGGYQSNSENSHGLDYCIKGSDGFSAIESVAREIREAVNGWMDSTGHRRNILTPWHRKLNIGLAWDTYNFLAYLHFEGDYVRFEVLPEIQAGTLTFSGELLNGSHFPGRNSLGVQLYYDPPPHPLTGGQLARTFCYDNGLRVASIRYPLPAGWSYPSDGYDHEYWPCPSPYDIPSDASVARSYREAMDLWDMAYRASLSEPRRQYVVPRITADEWNVTSSTFKVVADVSEVTEQHGPGVYTLVLWADLEGKSVTVAKYSMFYDITPPNTYDVENTEVAHSEKAGQPNTHQ